MTSENEALLQQYYDELAICLWHEGFVPLRTDGNKLRVVLNDQTLCEVDENGVRYDPEDVIEIDREVAKDRVFALSRQVQEYMSIFHAAPPLKAESLNDSYKTLLEYKDTILAARPSRFGMQFVTWEWDFNHKGLNHGHYYNSNYEGAKRDFAVRAGLVEPQPIFNKQQLVEIYRCCEDTLCGVYEMTDEQRATIRSAQDRIRDKHPDILELIREQDELYEDAMYADPKEPELSRETEIDIMWDDLKLSTQRRIQAMLGDNGNYDVLPIATIQADQEMQQSM